MSYDCFQRKQSIFQKIERAALNDVANLACNFLNYLHLQSLTRMQPIQQIEYVEMLLPKQIEKCPRKTVIDANAQAQKNSKTPMRYYITTNFPRKFHTFNLLDMPQFTPAGRKIVLQLRHCRFDFSAKYKFFSHARKFIYITILFGQTFTKIIILYFPGKNSFILAYKKYAKEVLQFHYYEVGLNIQIVFYERPKFILKTTKKPENHTINQNQQS